MTKNYTKFNYCINCVADTKEDRMFKRTNIRYPKIFTKCLLCHKKLRTKPRHVFNRLDKSENKMI